MQRAGANVVSQLTGLGDTPHLEKLIGPVKVQLDAYMKGETTFCTSPLPVSSIP
jgi:F-type H+-transporting ATPase subunit gamma